MNDETIEKLKASGWHENRRVDISEIVRWAERKGFFYPDNVKAFLMSYGFLHVRFVDPTGRKEEFDFDPLPSLKGAMDADWIQDIVEEYDDLILGETLYYIGTCYRRNMLTIVSETEKCFAYTDCTLAFLGDSFEEMLETLCYTKAPAIFLQGRDV